MAVVVVGLSAAAATAIAFSTQSEIVTAIGITLLWGAALVGPRSWGHAKGRRGDEPAGEAPRDRRPEPCFTAWLGWVLVLGAAVALELSEYVSLPRRAHPTLSVFINDFTSNDAGRAVAYLCWMILGLWISLQAAAGLRSARRSRR